MATREEETVNRVLGGCGMAMLLFISILAAIAFGDCSDEKSNQPDKHCTPIITTVPIGQNSSVTRVTYICH